MVSYRYGITNEEFVKEKGLTLAKKEALSWGGINSQRKIRTAPFPTWWFDCWGHGGYVCVSPKELFVGKWNAAVIYRGSLSKTELAYVYVFEEDCAWAVLEYYVKEIREAQFVVASKNPKFREQWPTQEAYDAYVLQTVKRWHPEAL